MKAYQDASNLDAGVKGQQELIWQITASKELLEPEGSYSESSKDTHSSVNQVKNNTGIATNDRDSDNSNAKKKKRSSPSLRQSALKSFGRSSYSAVAEHQVFCSTSST